MIGMIDLNILTPINDKNIMYAVFQVKKSKQLVQFSKKATLAVPCQPYQNMLQVFQSEWQKYLTCNPFVGHIAALHRIFQNIRLPILLSHPIPVGQVTFREHGDDDGSIDGSED